MTLTLMYITNNPEVARIAERYGVERIWVDLEVLGKGERQKNMDSVKSGHTVADVARLSKVVTKSDLLVRVNPWYEKSKQEIDAVIEAGANFVMLPMWKTVEEVKNFLDAVGGRCKTVLLLETKEAEACLDEVLELSGIDEVHIGLNDLHLSYGMNFMFEPLANGTVDRICEKLRSAGLPYGFGGIAKIGEGMLPAEKVIIEHYRLGSTRAILSRVFCDTSKITDLEEIEKIFRDNMKDLRKFEEFAACMKEPQYEQNRIDVVLKVKEIVRILQEKSR